MKEIGKWRSAKWRRIVATCHNNTKSYIDNITHCKVDGRKERATSSRSQEKQSFIPYTSLSPCPQDGFHHAVVTPFHYWICQSAPQPGRPNVPAQTATQMMRWWMPKEPMNEQEKGQNKEEELHESCHKATQTEGNVVKNTACETHWVMRDASKIHVADEKDRRPESGRKASQTVCLRRRSRCVKNDSLGHWSKHMLHTELEAEKTVSLFSAAGGDILP